MQVVDGRRSHFLYCQMAPLETLYREHLAKGNKLRFRALGGSMLPLIRSGDIVHVAPEDPYAVGDILLYERGSRWFVHRLIQRQSSLAQREILILRGDALPSADPPVPPEAVLGRVVLIERGERYIHLDDYLGKFFNLLATIPLLRYPVIPWTYVRLGGMVRRLRAVISVRLRSTSSLNR